MNFVGTGKRLTAKDFSLAAAKIGVPIATIQGVVDVEANGRGFDQANRPKILPEPHIFYKRLGPGVKRDRAVKLGVAYPKWGQKPYPKTSEANYQRLEIMMTVDEKKALESTSWGLPQIMGFNFKDAGYASAAEMVEDFKKGEGEQLDAFVTLITSWGLDDELQRRDARGFASKYNGKEFAKNKYDVKLDKAWAARDRGQEIQLTASDGVPTEPRSPTPEASSPVTEDLPEQRTKDVVLHVQTRLKELGYHEVGSLDGGEGGMTRTQLAITAFRLDNGLPIADPSGTPLAIDESLLVALATAKPRAINQTRADATVAELRPKNETLRTAFRNKMTAIVTTFGGGLLAVASGIMDFFGEAKEKLEPVRDLFTSVPGWVWGLGIAGVAYAMWRAFNRIESNQVEKHKTGELL